MGKQIPLAKDLVGKEVKTNHHEISVTPPTGLWLVCSQGPELNAAWGPETYLMPAIEFLISNLKALEPGVRMLYQGSFTGGEHPTEWGIFLAPGGYKGLSCGHGEHTRGKEAIFHITPWKNARVLMCGPEELLRFRGTSRNRSEPWEEAKQ